MPSLLLSAAVTCLGSLSIGGALLALCGVKRWSWLAAPIGFAILVLLAVPAIHLPGRSLTTAAVTGVLMVAGIAVWIRTPLQRPPVRGVLAALPVALMTTVPFVASGRAGTLGVSFDNDMSSHLLLAEAYGSAAVARISPLLPDYPLGPHALAATLAEGLGVRIDLAFAGLTAAIPVLIAWTALSIVRSRRWVVSTFVATIVGMPFLIAAYYGQGSFKELMEALFVLATALLLVQLAPELAWRRWIPFAIVCAGAVSVYSLQGLAWPAMILLLWIVGRAIGRGYVSGWRRAAADLRSELAPAAVGLFVLVVVLIPQIPRIEKFVSKGADNAITKSNLGNLVGPISGWEAFGTWNNPNYELPPLNAIRQGMWTALVLALIVLGAIELIRRGQWIIAFAAAGSVLIWTYSEHTQSPYIAAKALVIASPLLALVAVSAFHDGEALVRRNYWLAAPLLAVVLGIRIVDSSWEALRFSKVGPTDHLAELRSLRPILHRQPTLFLADDDFIVWELAGVPVTPAYFAGVPQVPLRPQKAFAYGQPLDFDAVTAATLNKFTWVITTRDAAGSQAPEGMILTRASRSYDLWRREADIAPRDTLDEGSAAAAVLDCATAAGSAIARHGGVAAVRAPTLETPVPPLGPGGTVTVTLVLPAGRWELETPYLSPLPLRVTVAGVETTLPANLERPGPRWPIGQVDLARAARVAATFHLEDNWLAPETDVGVPGELLATPAGGEHLIPLSQACGKLVDWYRPG